MTKRVAILQSCYIPWKGYFDLINSVDEFVLYDEVQYTRQDWRNRNRIKTQNGTRWLTIPVTVDDLYHQRLDETVVADPRWATRHWDTLKQSYRDAPHFRQLGPEIGAAYERCAAEPRLSHINRALLETVCRLLDIETRVTWSTEYDAHGSRTERVVSLCEQTRAGLYLSGPSARAYIDESLFERAGIELRYFDYEGYPQYPQLHPPFEHNVTILDLLFNAGPDARALMKSFAGASEARA
jgi:WbqC-like protein family